MYMDQSIDFDCFYPVFLVNCAIPFAWKGIFNSLRMIDKRMIAPPTTMNGEKGSNANNTENNAPNKLSVERNIAVLVLEVNFWA